MNRAVDNGIRTISGFTMIEVITVLLLLSVLAVVAVVRVGGVQDAGRINATAHTLAQNLVYARARAMSATEEQWEFQFGANNVLTRDGNPVSLPYPDGAVTPDNVTVTAGTVAFDAFGSPGPTNIVINVAGGDSARTITVHAETGLVEVQ